MTSLPGITIERCVATLQRMVDSWSGWKPTMGREARWLVRYDETLSLYSCDHQSRGGRRRLGQYRSYEMAYAHWCADIGNLAGVELERPSRKRIDHRVAHEALAR